jgi:hypothetical protein
MMSRFPQAAAGEGGTVRFGLFYEHQLPRPWRTGDEGQLLADGLEQRGGHVVNVSSALAYIPRATEPAYVATKSGLIALSQSVRADWRRSGVGVSVVCPGVTNTAVIDHTRFVGRRDDPRVHTPPVCFAAVTPRPRWRRPTPMPSTETGRSFSSTGRRAWLGRSTGRHPCGSSGAERRSSPMAGEDPGRTAGWWATSWRRRPHEPRQPRRPRSKPSQPSATRC